MGFSTRIIAGILLVAGTTVAQTAGLAPDFVQQFFDNNGQPLAGGQIYTCTAGGACPGSPQTSFTDSSAFTANSNPVILDSSGRANIWLSCTSPYKLVVQTSASVTIKTVDNVSCSSGGGGGSSTNYWTLSGTTINNNNASGAGNVGIGGGLSVANDITLNGALKLKDAQASPNYAIIRASSLMTADINWRWPGTDAVGCLTSDGAGNLTFATCGSGGGGGAGGNNFDVQYNSTGSLGGSDNFTWQNSAQLLTVIAASPSTQGIVVLKGYVQADNGFAAVNNLTPTTPLNYNVIQAPTGGMAALSFTAKKYVQVGNNSGIPPLTSTDTFAAGALYYDTGTHTMQLFNDSSAWVALAAGGATSPGGGTTNIQFNSAGSFAGTNSFIIQTSAGVTTVTETAASTIQAVPAIYGKNGYIQSDVGFLALPGTATQFNAFQAPSGGMSALSFSASKYAQTGNSSGVPSVTGGDTFAAGAMYWDTVLGAEQVFNGAAWVSLGTGGTGTPGTPTTSVQFNNGGAFAGSVNFEWNNTTRTLVVNTVAASQGLVVLGGYAQAEVGFLAAVNASPTTPLNYNAIQAPTGGVYAKSLRAINYVQTGSSAGAPAATTGDTISAGAMYWDTSGVEKVFNGSVWVSLATGGLSSLNTLTGAVNITNGGAINEIAVTTSGSSVVLRLPQPLGGGNVPTFSGVVANGAFNSTVTGGTTAFTANGGQWLVNGQGDMSGAGSANMNGSTGLGAYRVGGTVIVDSSRNASFATVVTSGAHNSTASGAATAYTITNGLGNPFIVDGNGNVSANGSFNANGATGLAPYRVSGTAVINSSGAFVGTGVGVGSGVVSGGILIISTQSLFNGPISSGGLAGVNGSTCSRFTNGICTQL